MSKTNSHTIFAAFGDTYFCRNFKRSKTNNNLRSIEKWINHEHYNDGGKWKHDIAILKLKQWQKYQANFYLTNSE